MFIFQIIEKGIKNKYFDPNATNLKNETPLHFQLKEGGKFQISSNFLVFKYVKTAMVLSSRKSNHFIIFRVH